MKPFVPDNSPATFDTPHADRPFTPSESSLRGERLDPDGSKSHEKTKDITDNHSLGTYT